MRARSWFLAGLVLLVLLLLPPVEMKGRGKGRGLRGARHKLTRDRVRGSGRHSRSDLIRAAAPDCSESVESGDLMLDCQDRRLASPPKPRAQEPKHLLLARNRIKVLRDGAFAGFEGLKTLDLQQNHISRIEEGAFQGLTQLSTLMLQHNRLGTLSEEVLLPLPGLRYLRLYDNPWSCVCLMDSLVRTIQVPSNRNLGNHARCSEPVWLKGKKLKQLDPELLCLEATHKIDPLDPQSKAPGPADPRPIRGKADATASCHTYLLPQPRMDCSGRGLTEVPSGVPEDVVEMDLSRNSIRHLKAKDFQGARSLRALNLSANGIEHIDTASLSGLLHLRELDLSNNSLSSVQYGVLEDLYFLSQLKLGGNPWVCDYSIHYMVYWLHLHPAVRHSGLLCRSPPEHAGQRVQAYVQSYNRECPRGRQQQQEQQRERGDAGQDDPELWDTAQEAQGEVEEELEPSHLRAPQKYQIIRLT